MSENVEDFVDVIAAPSASSSISDRGSRSGSIVGEVDSGPTDSEMLRILECPVCTEFPVPPIYNCAKGHFTCNDCLKVLGTCTLCESPFTSVRNFALESIIERTTFKCRYAIRGCQKTATGEIFKKHVENCEYGPLLCNEQQSIACDNRGFESPDYLEHLISCHNACGQSVPSERGRLCADFIQNKGNEFSTIYLKCEPESGPTFLLNTRKHKSFVCWWVTCLDPNEIENYKAKLTWNKNYSEEELSHSKEEDTFDLLQWKIPIHMIKTPFDEIRDAGLCAVLPETHLVPFIGSPESEVTWKISIEVTKKDNNLNITTAKFEKFNLKEFMDILRYYFPLIVIVLMSIALCLLYGMSIKTDERILRPGPPFTNEEGVGSSSGDYYGYRGFYYHDKTGGQIHEKRFDKVEDDVVGYRGFYKKNEGEKMGSQRESTTIFKTIVNRIFGSIIHTLESLFGFKGDGKSFHKDNVKANSKILLDSNGIIGKFLIKIFMFLFSTFAVIAVLISLTIYRKWLTRMPTGREPGNQNIQDDVRSSIRRHRTIFRSNGPFSASNIRNRNIDPLF